VTGGLLAVVSLLSVSLLGVSPVSAQSVDARFQPWIGCWRTIDNTDMPQASSAPTQACVVPSTQVAGSVDVMLFARDSLLSRNALPAAGTSTEKVVDDCRGMEKATWTSDNARLIMRADLTCSGNLKRVETGMMTITPEGEWLQLQHLQVGGNEATTTVRFRYNEGAALPRGVAFSGGRSNSSLRLAVGAPVNGDQVLDVASQAPAGLTEVWLAELGVGFELDGRALARLADRGMPPRVLDMMIAISNPRTFSVRPNDAMAQRGLAANSIVEMPPSVSASRMSRCSFFDDFCYGPGGTGAWGLGWQYGYGAWDPFNPWYGMNNMRFANRFGYPYGMGLSPWGGGPWGGGIYYGGGPVIVVGPPGEAQSQGRAIKGRGYTRSGGGSSEPATPRSGMSGSGSGGSSGSSSGSSGGGSSSGGSSGGSGRTAKPRPPGGL
jgi:hypothetical protein